MRRCWLALTLLFLIVPSLVGADILKERERPPMDDYNLYKDSYPGGPNALPYGLGNGLAVLKHARTQMECVQTAINDLLSRGYMRDIDGDAAWTRIGYSVVGLAFYRPTMDGQQVLPPSQRGRVGFVLWVISRTTEIPNVGWRPSTQMFAQRIALDANDNPICAPSALDPDIGYEAIWPGMDAPLATDIFNTQRVWFGAYDAMEQRFGVHQTHPSQAQQQWQAQLWGNIVIGGMSGAVGGAAAYRQTGMVGVGVGFIIGAWSNGIMFWYNNPPPPGH